MTTRPEPDVLAGTVVASTGSRYIVQVDGTSLSCTIRGRFRLTHTQETNPIAVGDHVRVQRIDDDAGVIVEVEERANKLYRRAAGKQAGRQHVIVANIDKILVVQSVRKPKFNPGFVDRVLVMAEVHDISAGIVINKQDLHDDRSREALDHWIGIYSAIDYEVFETSTRTGEGIDGLRAALAGTITAMVGPSGVGKSSLLNAVNPLLELKTGAVSEKTRKGKHVTTHAVLLDVGAGGYVVDTPGLREFGVVDIKPAELCHHFVEFIPHLDDCKFPNCTHDHEPECAVVAAVDRGEITEERWASYLNILRSLDE